MRTARKIIAAALVALVTGFYFVIAVELYYYNPAWRAKYFHWLAWYIWVCLTGFQTWMPTLTLLVAACLIYPWRSKTGEQHFIVQAAGEGSWPPPPTSHTMPDVVAEKELTDALNNEAQ